MRRCRLLAAITAAAVLAGAPTASTLVDAGVGASPRAEVVPGRSSESATADVAGAADVVTSSPSAAAAPAERSNDSGVAGTAVFVLALLAVVVIGAIVVVEIRGGRSS